MRRSRVVHATRPLQWRRNLPQWHGRPMPWQHALRVGHDLRHHLYPSQHDWLPNWLQVRGHRADMRSRNDPVWWYVLSCRQWRRRMLYLQPKLDRHLVRLCLPLVRREHLRADDIANEPIYRRSLSQQVGLSVRTSLLRAFDLIRIWLDREVRGPVPRRSLLPPGKLQRHLPAVRPKYFSI